MFGTSYERRLMKSLSSFIDKVIVERIVIFFMKVFDPSRSHCLKSRIDKHILKSPCSRRVVNDIFVLETGLKLKLREISEIYTNQLRRTSEALMRHD